MDALSFETVVTAPQPAGEYVEFEDSTSSKLLRPVVAALTASVLASWSAGATARDERPTGMLWHNSYTLDYRSGVQVSPLDGRKPFAITDRSEIDVAVWPDGRQIVVTRSRMRPRQTSVIVMESATGKAIHHGQVPGYLRDVEPSPTDRRLAKVR